jgi:hypothetical protein
MQYFFTTFMLRAKDTPQFGFWSTGASFRWCCGGLSSEVHDRLLVDGGLLDGVIRLGVHAPHFDIVCVLHFHTRQTREEHMKNN